MHSRIKVRLASYLNPTDDNNLLEALNPLYIVLTTLGLHPYILKIDERRGRIAPRRRSLYANALCAAGSLLFLLTFFMVHVEAILVTGKSFSASDVVLTQLNYILELLALLILCFASYVTAYANRSRYIRMLNCIHDTNSKISFASHSYREVFTHVRLLIFIVLPLICIVHIVVNSTRCDDWWKIFLVTASFVLPQLIQFCILFHIRVLILLIVSLLRSITECIKNYNPDKYATIKKVAAKGPLPLSQMKSVYGHAFGLSRSIDAMFMASILMTIASCFHSVISEGYILFHGVASGSMSPHQVVNCLLWVGWQLCKMILIGSAGNRLKTEAAVIGQILHNIPVEIESVRTLVEIQNFSAQVFHQRVELTVCGYFSLDYTLIYKMTAAAAMYFVILVQLDNQNHTVT